MLTPAPRVSTAETIRLLEDRYAERLGVLALALRKTAAALHTAHPGDLRTCRHEACRRAAVALATVTFSPDATTVRALYDRRGDDR
jgi:hypothetical protein